MTTDNFTSNQWASYNMMIASFCFSIASISVSFFHLCEYNDRIYWWQRVCSSESFFVSTKRVFLCRFSLCSISLNVFVWKTYNKIKWSKWKYIYWSNHSEISCKRYKSVLLEHFYYKIRRRTKKKYWLFKLSQQMSEHMLLRCCR